MYGARGKSGNDDILIQAGRTINLRGKRPSTRRLARLGKRLKPPMATDPTSRQKTTPLRRQTSDQRHMPVPVPTTSEELLPGGMARAGSRGLFAENLFPYRFSSDDHGVIIQEDIQKVFARLKRESSHHSPCWGGSGGGL